MRIISGMLPCKWSQFWWSFSPGCCPVQGPTPPPHPQSKGGVPETNCPPSGSWSTCGLVKWSEIRKNEPLVKKTHRNGICVIAVQNVVGSCCPRSLEWINTPIYKALISWFYDDNMSEWGGNLTCCALHRGKNVLIFLKQWHISLLTRFS